MPCQACYEDLLLSMVWIFFRFGIINNNSTVYPTRHSPISNTLCQKLVDLAGKTLPRYLVKFSWCWVKLAPAWYSESMADILWVSDLKQQMTLGLTYPGKSQRSLEMFFSLHSTCSNSSSFSCQRSKVELFLTFLSTNC